MRLWIVAPFLLSLAGCLTHRDRVAYKRAELVLQDRGAAGDELAAACGEEVANANIDTGASEVALGPADLTPESAKANSAAIKAARQTRQEIVAAGKGLLGSAGPWGATALALLTGAGALWLKVRKYRQVAETLVEGVGSVAHKDTKEAIRNLAVDYGLQPVLDKIVQRIDPKQS